MSSSALRLAYTFDEYVRFERDAREKHEFVSGAGVFTRGSAGFTQRSFGAGELAELPSLGVSLAVDEVFVGRVRARWARRWGSWPVP